MKLYSGDLRKYLFEAVEIIAEAMVIKYLNDYFGPEEGLVNISDPVLGTDNLTYYVSAETSIGVVDIIVDRERALGVAFKIMNGKWAEGYYEVY